jgi:hypothetical protein
MAKFNLKDQLAGIAALIAAIVAIGGGFIKYGEITTKLETLGQQSPEQAEEVADNSGNIIDNQQSIKILEKEMELLKVQMEELKESTSNPLSN